MNLLGIILFVVVILLLVALMAYVVRIVPQAKSYVIERLGAYHSTWSTGIHFVIPFIDRIANKVTLKEIVKEEDIQFLAESAFADACRPGNPRDTSVEEIIDLYKSLM